MSKYYGTYSCGHEGRVNVIGPEKNRQWIVDRKFEGMCPECYTKHLEEERIKANEISAEKAKEMELPELEGTEKQVAWATTLRQKLIDGFEKLISTYDEVDEKREIENMRNTLDHILSTEEKAFFYINNRFNDAFDTWKMFKVKVKTKDEKVEEIAELEVKAESTVKPEEAKSEITAEIIIKPNEVSVKFIKDEEFRKIVKYLGYKWDGIWCKKITELTGSAEDRAAELGNKLLNAGFPICIMDETIRNNAVNGIYEEECNRWIMTRVSGKYKGRFVIKWQGQDDDLYRVSRRLPGSAWDIGTIVRMEYHKEVEEFAELYGFKFTKGTLKTIEEFEDAKEKIEVVVPAKLQKEDHKDGLKEILNSSTDILDDLKED